LRPILIQRLGIAVLGATDWGNPNDIGGLNNPLRRLPFFISLLSVGITATLFLIPFLPILKKQNDNQIIRTRNYPLGQASSFLQANTEANGMRKDYKMWEQTVKVTHQFKEIFYSHE
jgi:hypothetical protein